ncbi:MAG TPA: type II toxin-antitoxin system VapC family toxin [Ignavibacteriaceae bacterium]|nr:type II toxin-antitoxin system VapC family toxin [Ignavibacteriaceae bacterium]
MIFIDTSAWVALEDKKDIHHDAALKFNIKIAAARNRLITTNYVLDETYTLLLLDIGYVNTIRFKDKLDDLINRNLIVVFHISSEIEKIAWNTFEQFNKDKYWSFTDCTSKVVMENYSIKESFSFDKHFEQMGFIRKP